MSQRFIEILNWIILSFLNDIKNQQKTMHHVEWIKNRPRPSSTGKLANANKYKSRQEFAQKTANTPCPIHLTLNQIDYTRNRALNNTKYY